MCEDGDRGAGSDGGEVGAEDALPAQELEASSCVHGPLTMTVSMWQATNAKLVIAKAVAMLAEWLTRIFLCMDLNCSWLIDLLSLDI